MARAIAFARVHTDGAADAFARSVGARAATVGRDVYFSRGAFAPATPAGAWLARHELGHVAQHAEGRVPADRVQRAPAPGGAAQAAPPAPDPGDQALQAFLAQPANAALAPLGADPGVAGLIFVGQAVDFLAPTEEQCRDAVRVLRKLPAGTLRTVLAGLVRTHQLTAILSNLPAVHGVALEPLYEAAPDMPSKIILWRYLFVGRSTEARALAGPQITDADTIAENERGESSREASQLMAGYEKAAAKAGGDRRRMAAVDAEWAGKLGAVDERKKLELEVEMELNIVLSGKAGRDWTTTDIMRIHSLLSRLPPSIVRDNPKLTRILRDKVYFEGGKKRSDVGGETSTPNVSIFDTGTTDDFRLGDTESLVGQWYHPGPLEQSLTHEIGHTVHAVGALQNGVPRTLDDFMKASGARYIAGAAALRRELADAGALPAEVQSDVATLDSRRKAKDETPVERGGLYFHYDKYHAGQYFLRPIGSLPGDVQLSTEHDDFFRHEKTRSSYAVSDPQDQYAELFAQMILDPEYAHRSMVEAPLGHMRDEGPRLRRRLAAAEAAVDRADDRRVVETRAGTPERKAAEKAYAEALAARDKARAELDVAETAARTRPAQWKAIRATLGMGEAAEHRAREDVHQHVAALAGGDAAKLERARVALALFDARVETVATPQQLEHLVKTFEGYFDRILR